LSLVHGTRMRAGKG